MWIGATGSVVRKSVKGVSSSSRSPAISLGFIILDEIFVHVTIS